MRVITTAVALAIVAPAQPTLGQTTSKTLVAVFAHADDETSVAPLLARYAREGARVHLIIVTDGAQGGANTSLPRGPELARARADEARCAATALGIQPPVLLGFPDGALGDYTDPSLLFKLTGALQSELQRLRPDAIVTWGPDGGTGHPDHRIVSSVVTQLVRAGAPGVPERLFYSYIPAEGFVAINPQRGTPPFLIPQPKYFTARVSFADGDLDAARRAMACHRTQYSEEVVARVSEAARRVYAGVLPLVPAFGSEATTDLVPPTKQE
jgi:LmbE family N-acetylglucosaminyl deacetylase